mgnify:CR=1 FL=1
MEYCVKFCVNDEPVELTVSGSEMTGRTSRATGVPRVAGSRSMRSRTWRKPSTSSTVCPVTG